MTAFDVIVVLVVVASVGVSIWRGLAREVLSLLSWVGAFWLAQLFAGVMANGLPEALGHSGIRVAVGFTIVLVASLLVFSLMSRLVFHLVKVAGLTTSDRVLGAVFGVLRGGLMVLILVLLGGMTSAPRQAYWREALFSASLVAAALWVKPWLPPEVSRRVNFE